MRTGEESEQKKHNGIADYGDVSRIRTDKAPLWGAGFISLLHVI
jgi:hypothetical protein